jgi:hypothetical protein
MGFSETLSSAVADVGFKRGLVIVGGCVLVLLGLVGLALSLASSQQTIPERTRPRRRLFMTGSALLIAIGALAILGVGIIIPLGALRLQGIIQSYEDRNSARQLAKQVDGLLQAQSVQALREILSRPKYQDRRRLNRYELRVCSQNGEDGIIAEIFRRLGATNRYFVEFGSSNGIQNNTALLLRQGWCGLWMDADAEALKEARRHFADQIATGKLTVLEAFITAENIEDLFQQGKVPEEFDLLSIDIDRNDYHVWEKVTRYRPRVVVIEYNAGIPATMSWVIPYDPKAFGNYPFGSGNGASLKALEELGARKGYSLVGCDLCGVNSFFIRNDLVGDHFAAPYTAANHFEPFRFGRIAIPLCDPGTGGDQEKETSSPRR